MGFLFLLRPYRHCAPPRRAWQLYDTRDSTKLAAWLLTRGTRIMTVAPDGAQLRTIGAALLG